MELILYTSQKSQLKSWISGTSTKQGKLDQLIFPKVRIMKLTSCAVVERYGDFNIGFHIITNRLPFLRDEEPLHLPVVQLRGNSPMKFFILTLIYITGFPSLSWKMKFIFAGVGIRYNPRRPKSVMKEKIASHPCRWS